MYTLKFTYVVCKSYVYNFAFRKRFLEYMYIEMKKYILQEMLRKKHLYFNKCKSKNVDKDHAKFGAQKKLTYLKIVL